MRKWLGRASVFAFAMISMGVSGARAGLDEYVKKPDPEFAWKETGKEVSEVGTVYSLDLTSQVWQGIPWNHNLRIYEPAQVEHPDEILLFITGGSTTSRASAKDHEMGFGLARLCGARVAVLPQVPNQPLLGDKTEDTLIAETFVRYLETKDENWPLLFPMVKSAVRAMDAVEAWSKENEKPAAKRFVVTGASKRGWTTWLTGAVDKRVAGIAPMVIVMLNLKAQNANQLKVWGKYSEQIDDYTNRGLMNRTDDADGKKLWEMVDPFFYRERLTMPKLLINGTNDRYWTLDAMDLYWDELKGSKSVVYLPDAGHGLDQHRDYALNGIGAFFRHVATDRPMPSLDWKFGGAEDGPLTLTLDSSPRPKSARIWTARSETRDFRESKWEPSVLKVGPALTAEVARPEQGNVAFFADLEFEIEKIPYHLTTQIDQTGEKPAR
ncbi:PhoPQ-activated pathogenicity-related family protein [Tundrisphaera lichenicola]|uniref:PhoPQ-activated pathogenicity-related family protein n=1 Tax=Tundrisphaera lichenicola TaxID=2029860 RepID=UPI003EBD5B3A